MIPAKMALVNTRASYENQNIAHASEKVSLRQSMAVMRLACRRPAQEFRELGTVGRIALVEKLLIDVVPNDVEEVHDTEKQH